MTKIRDLLSDALLFPARPMLVIYSFALIHGFVVFVSEFSGRWAIGAILSGLCFVAGVAFCKLGFAFAGYHLGPSWKNRSRTPILIAAIVVLSLFFCPIYSNYLISFEN